MVKINIKEYEIYEAFFPSGYICFSDRSSYIDFMSEQLEDDINLVSFCDNDRCYLRGEDDDIVLCYLR